MANNLSEYITGRYVVVAEECFNPQYRDIKYRVFHARGGFGCSPATMGSAVTGETPYDGEEFRIEGYQIERYATDEEIAMVTSNKATL